MERYKTHVLCVMCIVFLISLEDKELVLHLNFNNGLCSAHIRYTHSFS